MPAPSSRRRGRMALLLAGLAALTSAVMLAPILTYSHWLARLALRETSLAVTVVAGIALSLTIGAGGHRAARMARALAAPSALAGLLPFLGPLVLFREAGAGFSLREYVTWGRPRPAIHVERDVVLDPGSPQLTADVYHAAGHGPRPLVVAAHGGSWRRGDKGQGPELLLELAAGGYTVVDVRYSLAPTYRFPRAVADVKCVLGRARERAGALNVDPTRAALLGRSAGGQVALVAAYSAGDPRIPPACAVADSSVQGVVSLYAPTDLVYGHRNPMRPDVVGGTEALEWYLGGPPEAQAEAYRLGSPQSWADRLLPPTLLIHGSGDRIVRLEHARRLAAELTRRGRPIRLLAVPLAEHGFDVRPGGVGEQLARHAILGFLGQMPSQPAASGP